MMFKEYIECSLLTFLIQGGVAGPSCQHGQAEMRAVRKEGPNKGRLFYTCPVIGPTRCKVATPPLR